jgi:predicted DNA-binding transcriptional regulator AlpA
MPKDRAMVRRVRLRSIYERQFDKRGDLSPEVGEVAPHRSASRRDAEHSHPPGVLRKRELARRLSVNPWTVDRLRKSDPSFPQPIWLTPTTPVWLAAEVDAWLGSRPRDGIAPSWLGMAPKRLRKQIKVREAADAR